MKIYGPVGSRALRALWTAEEAQVPYEHVHLSFRKGEHKSPEYLKLNPNGRAPALVDGDLVIFESAAISLYIARKDSERRLLPTPDTAEAALHDQWMFWVTTELEQALWTMGKHRFALPAEHRVSEIFPTAMFEWQRAVPVLADALEGKEFLVGNHLTVADLFAAHTLNWAKLFKVPLGYERLDHWVEEKKALPSYQRVEALRR